MLQSVYAIKLPNCNFHHQWFETIKAVFMSIISLIEYSYRYKISTMGLCHSNTKAAVWPLNNALNLISSTYPHLSKEKDIIRSVYNFKNSLR